MVRRALEEFPVLAVMHDVLFPNGVVTLQLCYREWDRRSDDLCGGLVLVATLRPGRELRDRAAGLYRVGTIARIVPQRLFDEHVELAAVGLERARVRGYRRHDLDLRALAQPFAAAQDTAAGAALLRELRITLQHLAGLDRRVAQLYAEVFAPIDDPWQLTDLIAANLLQSLQARQRLLSARNPDARVSLIRELLRQLEAMALASRSVGAARRLH
jgi:Lon protease-like protein